MLSINNRIKKLKDIPKSLQKPKLSLIFHQALGLKPFKPGFFHELPFARLPNQKQTACEACPGNLVANATIGECWCPRGDLVFNDQYDNCEYSQISYSN